jgi:hypothetical protein
MTTEEVPKRVLRAKPTVRYPEVNRVLPALAGWSSTQGGWYGRIEENKPERNTLLQQR